MKRHNFNKRLHETRNIYPADFYEFDKILTKNGWVPTDFRDLEKQGKKYLGIHIRNKRSKNHPKYVSFDELKEILKDYFDGNVRFSMARYKYAPEISENVIIVDSDIFDYADDQLEFDFNESKRTKINTLSKFRENLSDTAFIRAVNLKDGKKIPLGIWCDNQELMHKAEDYIRYEYGNMNVFTFDTVYNVEKEGRKAYSKKAKESYTIRKNAKNLK